MAYTDPENIITIDIETLPSSDPAMLDRFRAMVKAPGQYKKAESIAQWLDENRDPEALAMLAKTGLDGLYGRVCVIGFAVGSEPVKVERLETDDREFLERAFAAMDRAAATKWENTPGVRVLRPVGHNVEFDLKFLFQRAVRYGIKLPRCIDPAAWTSPRYSSGDTMSMWCRYGERVKLRDLASELLGDPCDDIAGGDVAAAWADNPALVVDHCMRDVERTRALYRRMLAVLP